MPIYLYQCDACGVRFERMQRFAEQPLTECPECDGHVHRIIQPVGIIFKGSGFYVTDNRQAHSSTLKPPKDSDKDEAPTAPAEGKSEPAAAGSTDERGTAGPGRPDPTGPIAPTRS